MEKLAVVAIIKNEAQYLLEWITFHRVIGLGNFIIYNNGSTDESTRILEKYSSITNIKIINWPTIEGVSPQISAYNNFINTFSEKYEFAAFIDLDEFIYPNINLSLLDYLDKFSDHVGAIALNQRVFGSSGHLNSHPDLVINRFSMCSENDYDENRWIKSIYRLSCVNKITSSHCSELKSGYYAHVDFSEVIFEGYGKTKDIVFEPFQLNHYILKSYEEFQIKKNRGGVMADSAEKRVSRYDENFFCIRDKNINSFMFNFNKKLIDQTYSEIKRITKIIGMQ